MERVLSQEDRIKRAEEIYLRRKYNSDLKVIRIDNSKQKKGYRLLKRMVIQTIFCVGIFFFIDNIQANSDSLSRDSTKYIKNMLSYDMNLKKYVDEGKIYWDSFYNKNQKEETQDNQKEENEHVEITTTDNDENNVNIMEETNGEESNLNNNKQEDTNNLSKEEQDAKYIKEKFSLIKPVEGEISSRFGPRSPTTQTVPKYHTGIDIAVPEGTIFIASMDGTVENISQEGDYR